MLIFFSWLLSLLINAAIYPDHFVRLDRIFLNSPDDGIPFVHTFSLVNQLFHGGIQLFDRFDQFSYAYGHMSAGVYSLDYVVTAILYILFSPFFAYQAIDFHHFYSYVFYAFTALIRIFGGYFLLSLFVKNRLVIFVSLVYLNTFLSSMTMYNGIFAQTSLSFLPLLIYFILRYFQLRRLNDIIAALALLLLIVSNQPLMGLGYFYVIVHFFIIFSLVHALITNKWRISLPKIRWPMPKTFVKLGALLLLGILLILPTVIMTSQLKSDFYIAGSGLGSTEGRLNNIFKPLKYFTIEGKSCANPLDFFFRSLDFEHYLWPQVYWMFLGIGVLGFTLIGLVLAKDSRKHIFWLTITAVILLNVAPYPNNLYALFWYLKAIVLHPILFFHQGLHLEMLPIYLLLTVSSLVHWVNALTNPLSFLLRSFHMPGIMMPVLFTPLMALGLSACVDLVNANDTRIYRGRLGGLIILLVIILIICAYSTVGSIRIYTILGISVFLMFLCTALNPLPSNVWNRGRALGFFVILMVLDLVALNAYAQSYAWPVSISSRVLPGLPGKSLLVEYQNPHVLAYREYFRLEPLENTYALPCIYYGLFYQFTPMARNLVVSDIYTPIPMAYRNMYRDQWMKIYLKRNQRLIDFRDDGILDSQSSISELVSRNLENRILLVDDKKAGHLADLSNIRLGAPVKMEQWRQYDFLVDQAKKRNAGFYREYGFKLPTDFPKYLSTCVFTQDYNSWQLKVGQKVLSPVQGVLKDPYTFDVQNVRAGWLVMLLPAEENVEGMKIELKVKSPEYISNVWRNEQDHLGITFNAPHDGWIIFHYPYDSKWHLSVDDKPTPLYKVNQYFMGTPIPKGEHQVLLTYWPDTPLRWLLIVSMILSFIVFEGLIIYAFRDKNLKLS